MLGLKSSIELTYFMADYKNLIKVLNFCKMNPEKWDQSASLHNNGRFDFLGIAAMFECGLDPLKDDYRAKLSQSILPSLDHAANYLRLNSFELALFWNYYNNPPLTIRELEDLIGYVSGGKEFTRDGLTLTRNDLVLSRG